jgi:hypothetical protein
MRHSQQPFYNYCGFRGICEKQMKPFSFQHFKKRMTHSWKRGHSDSQKLFQLRNEARGVPPDVELNSFNEVTGNYVFFPASYEVNYQERDNRIQSFIRSTLASISD